MTARIVAIVRGAARLEASPILAHEWWDDSPRDGVMDAC